MMQVTRRWCLLAIAGVPVVLGISAQALSVRLDNDFLRVSAPNLDFLKDTPLDRLKDGKTVGYLAQLTVSTGTDRIVQGRSIVHFAISYDIWAERFKVTVLAPGSQARPAQKNLTREAAVRFSFLLSTPIIAGAALVKAHELRKEGLPAGMHMPFLVGILVSAVVGYAAISWLVRYLQSNSLRLFIVYRIVLGIVVIALAYVWHLQ